MTLAARKLTPAEYLARERKARTKSEFLNGDLFARAGADEAHNLLVANILAEIHAQFKGRKNCKVYPGDMRVKVDASGLYTYPDISALCGEARFEDAEVDTLTNPSVIFEVLSPSTEAYDRGDKFAMYRTLPSLSDYVLVSSNQVRIEHFNREVDGAWRLVENNMHSDVLEVPSIKATLKLLDVYDKVELAPPRRAPRRRRR